MKQVTFTTENTIKVNSPEAIYRLFRADLATIYRHLSEQVDNYNNAIWDAEHEADRSNLAVECELMRLHECLGAANAALHALGQAAYN